MRYSQLETAGPHLLAYSAFFDVCASEYTYMHILGSEHSSYAQASMCDKCLYIVQSRMATIALILRTYRLINKFFPTNIHILSSGIQTSSNESRYQSSISSSSTSILFGTASQFCVEQNNARNSRVGKKIYQIQYNRQPSAASPEIYDQ